MSIPVTWLASVYRHTKLAEFIESYNSILHQDIDLPSEILIIIDGPIMPDLYSYLSDLYSSSLIRLFEIETNVGLGVALSKGVSLANGDFIFRFDTDDINHPSRLSSQYSYMTQHPSVDILGSFCYEFLLSESLHDLPVRSTSPFCSKPFFLSFFNYLNHPTVVIRRSSLDKFNLNYQHMPYFEDYFLWLQCRSYDFTFDILPLPLVYMRVSSTISRRVGSRLALNELNFYLSSYRAGLLSPLYFPIHTFRILFRLKLFLNLYLRIRSYIFGS